MDRIGTFKTFITRAPADPFPRYGLAMEYKGAGALTDAWTTFEELLAKFPDYVPTYLMAGGTLVALGRPAQAAEIFRTGIEVSARRGDLHAKKELETALAELSPT
jgi:predicted Zn-dependent protease